MVLDVVFPTVVLEGFDTFATSWAAVGVEDNKVEVVPFVTSWDDADEDATVVLVTSPGLDIEEGSSFWVWAVVDICVEELIAGMSDVMGEVPRLAVFGSWLAEIERMSPVVVFCSSERDVAEVSAAEPGGDTSAN